ncbi:MAG: sensor histidine kinase [Anaerolineales bacterium]|nr:sensor histidine kinase [Anaerolineales bacterium]
MSQPVLGFVYFVYGLAFFNMGLAIVLEGGRAADARLRHALRPLAVFGLVHGVHEWFEMFQALRLLPAQDQAEAAVAWEAVRLTLLTFSFLSLSAFGASLLATNERRRRLSLLVPLAQAALWGLGLLAMRGDADLAPQFWTVVNVWSRYVLAVPAALLAAVGLVAQQRAFRRAGLMGFGRDSLWAAVAFAWYGLVGQVFVPASPLPPSNILNQELFASLFGFPIQMLRAGAAIMAAVFVVRFLRAFDVEARRQIAELQAERLKEAERREALRGELLRRVVAAQEAERQRIARELHDATGQTLTALGLGLRGVASTLGDATGPALKSLRELEKMTADSLDELGHLIADLRPSHLDDLGLPATLRWYAKVLQARVPLEIHVEVTGAERRLAPAANIALFRAAQEALTNVVKHSGARQAWIHLSYDETLVRLDVRDNGRGFNPAETATAGRAAWGLLGMQERVALLGGHFQVVSQPGQGTLVQMMIPTQAAAEAA